MQGGGDDAVTFLDFLAFIPALGNLSSIPSRSDLDGSGMVNFIDFTHFIFLFGKSLSAGLEAADHAFDTSKVLGLELLSDHVGGSDTLEGGQDDDLIYGQFGDDRYLFAGGGLGSDRLVEVGLDQDPDNDLHDLLDFSQFVGSVDVGLNQTGTQTVNDKFFETAMNLTLSLSSETAFEDVIGSEFDDKIEGNSRDNLLAGSDGLTANSGNDILLGRAGNDELRGAGGLDLVFGGLDIDELWGGDGSDIVIGSRVELSDVQLEEARQIWTDGRSYDARIESLTQYVGLLQANVTVFADQSSDTIRGEEELDLYFAALAGLKQDKLEGLTSEETLFDLS